jgi:DNA mismatch endonuclease (patch repair protein)
LRIVSNVNAGTDLKQSVPLAPPTKQRSRIMSAIRGTGNATTELALAKVLRRLRLTGWRRHLPLRGRPDFAWPSLRVAVFVDGCFWHGCPHCYRAPRANAAFWRAKVEANRRRDRRTAAALRRAGWSVLRVWECRVRLAATEGRLLRLLRNRGHPQARARQAQRRRSALSALAACPTGQRPAAGLMAVRQPRCAHHADGSRGCRG